MELHIISRLMDSWEVETHEYTVYMQQTQPDVCNNYNTVTHRGSSVCVYNADLVCDLPVFKHDPLFASICIFLYADRPL